MPKRITTAAYLAGVTSLAVSLPTMASAGSRDDTADLKKATSIQIASDEEKA